MAEGLAVALEGLQRAIDSFMTMPCIVLGPFVRPRNKIVRPTALRMLVSAISFHHLIRAQHVDKAMLEDLQIRPRPTTKWAVYPDNMPGLDANTNFVSHTWTIELVRKPRPAERCRLLDSTINSIDCNFTSPVSISEWSNRKPVIPANLRSSL